MKRKYIIPLVVVGFIALPLLAMAVVTPYYSGGTGTTTAPAKGSLLVGANGTTYGPISVGGNGTCLVASSTAQGGIAWQTCTGSSTLTGLTVSNFASPNISQWTNNSGYISTSTGLTVLNFASPNISQWTNNSGYITSTPAFTNANASSGIAISTSSNFISIQNIGVVSHANNSASGGIDFSAASGTGITGVLHSLSNAQFTNGAGFITSAPATATIGGALAPFNFSTAFSGSSFTIATTTSGGSSTVTFTVPKNLSAFTNDAGFITTSTASAGTVVTSTAPTSGTIPIWTNTTNALGNSLITQANGVVTLPTSQFNGTSTFTGDMTIASATIINSSPRGYTLSSDFGAYINNLCTTGLANASSVQINLPGMNVPSSSYTTGINFNTLKGQCSLNGIGGNGTVLNWGGPTSTPAITLQSTAINTHVRGGGVFGIRLINQATGGVISTSTYPGNIGIMAGGSPGGAAYQFVMFNTINNFAYGEQVASNTYHFRTDYNVFNGNAIQIQVNSPVSNATEMLGYFGNDISDPANHNPSDCINLLSGDDIEFEQNMIDDCQTHVHNSAIAHFIDNKTEHPDTTYPNYVPFLQDNSSFSVLTIFNEKVYTSGGASGSFTALFDLNGQFDIQNVTVDKGAGTTTIADVLINSAGGTNQNGRFCNLTVNQFNGAPIAEFAPKGTYVPSSTWSGCAYQVGNSNISFSTMLSNGTFSSIGDAFSFMNGNNFGSLVVGTTTAPTPSNALSFSGIQPELVVYNGTNASDTMISVINTANGKGAQYAAVANSAFARYASKNTSNGATWYSGLNGTTAWSVLDASSSGNPIPFTIDLGAPSTTLRLGSQGNVLIGGGSQSLPSGLVANNRSLLQFGSVAIVGGNASGTYIGGNAPAGYTGDFANYQVTGTREFGIDASGDIFANGNINASGTITQAGVPVLTTSTNNFGGLTNASITATAPIAWSAGSVISWTGPATNTMMTVTPTNVLANNFHFTSAAGSAALNVTSSLYGFTDGRITINDATGSVFAANQGYALGILEATTTNNGGFVLVNPQLTGSARWWVDSGGTQHIDNGAGASLPIVINSGGGTLATGGTFNASGTITQSGVAVLTNTNVSGTINNIPIFTAAHTVGNSTLSQSGGATFLNATQIIDGGGNWTGNIVQAGPSSVITQNPTSTASLGNLIQSGGVLTFTTSTQVSGAQFCSGGEIMVASTTATTTLTLPTMATLASTTLTPCAASIWSSGFSQQMVVNSSTNNVTEAVGAGQNILYAAGTPTVLAPGQTWIVTGQFVNTSTVQGSQATGTILQVYTQLYQTSTPLTVTGNTITMSQITNGLVSANGSGVLSAFAGSTCAGGSYVSAVSATGTVTCSAPAGVISTSSAVTAFNFPYWNSAAALAGTSTIYYSTSTGNISIGTSTPANNTILIVSPAATAATTSIAFRNTGAATTDVSMGYFATGTAQDFRMTQTAGSFRFLMSGGGAEFFQNGNTRLQVGGSLESAPSAFYIDNTAATLGNITASTTPSNSSTSAAFQLGAFKPVAGNVSGTWIGINAASGYNGDFVNFQNNSSTEFKVSSSGIALFGGSVGVATSSGPTVSACGTTPTSTGSNSVANITLGTGGITACTYNFSPKWVNPPVCVVSDSSSTDAIEINSVSTSSVTLGFALSIAGGNAYLHCLGNPN